MNKQHEIESADEMLDIIIAHKRELESFLNVSYSGLEAGAKEMRAPMEEIFDETYHKLWVSNREISGDIGWPIHIPPLGALRFRTPVDKANDAYKARRIVTNPATKQSIGEPL